MATNRRRTKRRVLDPHGGPSTVAGPARTRATSQSMEIPSIHEAGEPHPPRPHLFIFERFNSNHAFPSSGDDSTTSEAPHPRAPVTTILSSEKRGAIWPPYIFRAGRPSFLFGRRVFLCEGRPAVRGFRRNARTRGFRKKAHAEKCTKKNAGELSFAQCFLWRALAGVGNGQRKHW